MQLVMSSATTAQWYLNVLKQNLTRIAFLDRHRILKEEELRSRCPSEVADWICRSGLVLLEERTFGDKAFGPGHGWPMEAETMVSVQRLENIEKCLKDILHNDVPGDLLEAGVWRGGTCIFMRALLAAYGDRQRTVWVADSFQGLPKPDPETYPQDGRDTLWGRLWQAPELAIALQSVKVNFARYGLLDDQVRFLPGWFRDTLPSAPIDQLALLRLDGDLYESTIVSLDSLYAKVSLGGYVLVDDYGAIPACKQAVDEFRARHSIREPIRFVDWTGVFWQVERQLVGR
jgi:O-methyltransferase